MKYVFAVLILFFAGAAQAENARVVATIKPLHSLVTAVMEGSGDAPTLLVDGNASPHTFQLRPSQVQALASAEIVFAIGARMEPFLARAQVTFSRDSEVVLMAEQPGMFLLPVRVGEGFAPHDHSHDEEHSRTLDDARAYQLAQSAPQVPVDYDAVKSGMQNQANWAWSGGESAPGAASNAPFSDKNIRAIENNAARQMMTGAERLEVPASGGMLTSGGLMPATQSAEGADPHLWLDPMNAITMVDVIVQRLIARYPGNASLYASNGKALQARIAEVDAAVRARMQPLAGKRFIVFHDAYQYFERAFGLQASASVLLSPEIMPGAAHLLHVREVIEKSGAVCAFKEPQFDDATLKRVVGNLPVRIGTLDPEGAMLANGAGLYPALLLQLANQFETCLK